MVAATNAADVLVDYRPRYERSARDSSRDLSRKPCVQRRHVFVREKNVGAFFVTSATPLAIQGSSAGGMFRYGKKRVFANLRRHNHSPF